MANGQKELRKPSFLPDDDVASDNRIHLLWIGNHLSLLEKVCLASFIGQGYTCWLWAYDPGLADQVMDQVVLRNAGEIIPPDQVFRYSQGNEFGHGKGSYAGFSDLFRYKVLFEYGGWWSDMDVICLKPLPEGKPYVFRKHDVLPVVGNLMKVPPRSPLMQACYQRTRHLVHSENRDWLLPIRILNEEIERLGLLAFRQNFTNPDRWEYVRFFRLHRSTIPGHWKAFHWMNEEWRARHLSKEEVYAGSLLHQLCIQFNIPVKSLKPSPGYLQRGINYLKMKWISRIPHPLRLALKRLIR